jgi:hypothetical protein
MLVHMTNIIQAQIHALGTDLSWGIDQISGMVRMLVLTCLPASVHSQPKTDAYFKLTNACF